MVMFRLYLKITGLTQEERYILIKKIELILSQISPVNEKDLDYSVLKHSPNWIELNTIIDDPEKAWDCYRLLTALDFKHEPDTYYKIYEDVHMTLNLEVTKEWV